MLLQWSPSRPVTVFGSGRTCLRCSKAVDVVKRGRGSELLPHSVGILRGDVFANSFNLRRPSSAPIEETFSASSQEIGRPRRKKIATLSRKISGEFCWDPGIVSVKDRIWNEDRQNLAHISFQLNFGLKDRIIGRIGWIWQRKTALISD